jgi:hypothetical protein
MNVQETIRAGDRQTIAGGRPFEVGGEVSTLPADARSDEARARARIPDA